jgi:hypothetical protein
MRGRDRERGVQGNGRCDLAEAETDPTTRMDGIATKGGGGRPNAKLPRRVAPTKSGIGEVNPTVKVGR